MFISIGGSCSVAYNLKKYKLRDKAFPFDLISTKLNFITESINNDFYGWLEKKNYIKKKISINHQYFNELDKTDMNSCEIKNIKTKISYFHDINLLQNDYDTELDNFLDKYSRRIERFYETIKNNDNLIFIRDETHPNLINEKDIENFYNVIKKINIFANISIIIILRQSHVASPQETIPKQDFCHTLPYLKIHYDLAEDYGSWKRENVDWESIFTINTQCLLRNCITVNVNETDFKYIDNSTNKILIDIVHKIIQNIILWYNGMFINNNIYFRLEMSSMGDIGIKFSNISENYIVDNIDFLYKLNISVILCDDKIMSTQLKLNETHGDFSWKRSVGSFIQCSNSENIHLDVIKKLKTLNNSNYLGIGGYSSFYSLVNRNSYNNVKFISDTKCICNDAIDLNIDTYYVSNYNDIKIKDYYIDSNTTCVINIGRKGLRNIGYQINELDFNDIIYIICSKEILNKDLNILTKYKVMDITTIPIINDKLFNASLKKFNQKSDDASRRNF